MDDDRCQGQFVAALVVARERTLAVKRLPRYKFRLSNNCQGQVVAALMVAGERTLVVDRLVGLDCFERATRK